MGSWWVGGYGPDMGGTSAGIGLVRSRDDGSLEYEGVVAPVASPSFLARQGDHLYAAAEGAGTVESFLLPGLGHDGGAPSGGTSPCHLVRIPAAVVVANYGTGELGVVGLRADGSVRELVGTLAGRGSGPHRAQGGPHAHASLLLDDGTLLSVDLGADRIHVHTVHGEAVERTASVEVPAGTGPRDIVLHASGLVYVLGEHGGELIVLEWKDGVLGIVSSEPLPGRLHGDQSAAIAFDGRFVYAGLRGSNRISVLESSPDGRALNPVGWVSCEGEWPRHLVAHDGVLHVANQLSNSIASFRLGDDGMPELIAAPVPVPSPTYLLATGTADFADRESLVK